MKEDTEHPNDQSDTSGAQQRPPLADEDDRPFQPGGSAEPIEDPEEPGGSAANHHPPAS